MIRRTWAAADFAWMEPSAPNRLTVAGRLYSGAKTSRHRRAGRSGGNILGRWTHATPAEPSMNLQFYYDHTHLSHRSPQVLRFLLSSVAFPPAP